MRDIFVKEYPLPRNDDIFFQLLATISVCAFKILVRGTNVSL